MAQPPSALCVDEGNGFIQPFQGFFPAQQHHHIEHAGAEGPTGQGQTGGMDHLTQGGAQFFRQLVVAGFRGLQIEFRQGSQRIMGFLQQLGCFRFEGFLHTLGIVFIKISEEVAGTVRQFHQGLHPDPDYIHQMVEIFLMVSRYVSSIRPAFLKKGTAASAFPQGQAGQVLAVQPGQLLHIVDSRLMGHLAEIELFHRIFQGEDFFVIARSPSQQGSGN